MDKEQAREIQSKGGNSVSLNRQWMREIGARGGVISGQRRREKKLKPVV